MSFYNKFPSFKFDRSNHNNFVSDLRKELENDREQNRKMFGESDFGDFGNFFAGHPSRPNLRSRLGQHHPAASSFFSRNFDTPHSSASSSSGAGSSSASSNSSDSTSSGERVIPIRVCTDDDDDPRDERRQCSSPKPTTNSQKSSSPAPNSKADDSSSNQQKSYSTQRNNTTEMPRVKEEFLRGQRASSAPPSSANINMTECGGGQSKKSGTTNVRTIPIHVENSSSSASNNRSNSPSNFHQDPHRPQSRNQQPQPPQQQQQPDGGQPTPPKKPHKILDPLEKIAGVAEQVKELAEKVLKFNGADGKTKEYLFLDEMLTRLLIQLDDVEVEGRDDIRQARRECIRSIQKNISDLDIKIQGDNNTSNSVEGETATTTNNTAPMEDGEMTSIENTIPDNQNNPANNEQQQKDKVVPMSIDDAGNQGQGDQVSSSSSPDNATNSNAGSVKETINKKIDQPPLTNQTETT